MLILQKLYLREFIKVFFILAVGISAVFSTIGLIEKIDELLPYRPAPLLLAEYVLLTFPKYAHYLLPMATLLSSLFIFSQAIGRREIAVIKASGAKMKRMLLPFLGLGILLVLLAFFIGEVLLPASSKKIQAIRNQITKRERGVTFKGGTLYMRGKDGSIVKVSLYFPEKRLSKDVSIFRFDEGGLKERIDAESATWQGARWRLEGVTVFDITSGKTTALPEMIYDKIESQKIFQEDLWKVEEMTIMEIIEYQERLRQAGFKNMKLSVDISSRLSYPLVNLFMLLLGISLSMVDVTQRIFKAKLFSRPGSGSGMIAAGAGLLISLLYWFGHSFILSLGYAGTVPPLIAPWVLPFIFAVFSIYLYSQIPE